jgi:hypothetical protein
MGPPGRSLVDRKVMPKGQARISTKPTTFLRVEAAAGVLPDGESTRRPPAA